MLAAAVVPHPPLLVPDLAAGATGLVAPLLTACDKVVAGLLARRPRLIVVVGSGPDTRIWPDADTGTLAGFGGVPASIIDSHSPEKALSQAYWRRLASAFRPIEERRQERASWPIGRRCSRSP